MADARSVTVVVDGRSRTGFAEPRLLLSDFLRRELGVTGVHVACEQGGCGACTVLLEGRLALSCLTLAVQADGSTIETVEGLGRDGELHPIQRAFQACHGLQCGFCTPGMMMTGVALLGQNPNPSEPEIRHAISGNLCRCTGYVNIVKSIQYAAARLR